MIYIVSGIYFGVFSLLGYFVLHWVGQGVVHVYFV